MSIPSGHTYEVVATLNQRQMIQRRNNVVCSLPSEKKSDKQKSDKRAF